MEPSEPLQEVTGKLDALGMEHFVTGSMASIVYGEPRFTNDVDIVIRVRAEDVPRLCAVFPEAAREAAARRTQFNVIHPSSGLKVDFMVAGEGDFDRGRFERARLMEIVEGYVVRIAGGRDRAEVAVLRGGWIHQAP